VFDVTTSANLQLAPMEGMLCGCGHGNQGPEIHEMLDHHRQIVPNHITISRSTHIGQHWRIRQQDNDKYLSKMSCIISQFILCIHIALSHCPFRCPHYHVSKFTYAQTPLSSLLFASTVPFHRTYNPPNNQAAAITRAMPDPLPAALTAAAPVDDALALALELLPLPLPPPPPLPMVGAGKLPPNPLLVAVVVNELGGKEVLVAGALVFCTVM
jgi:hypothetical protein